MGQQSLLFQVRQCPGLLDAEGGRAKVYPEEVLLLVVSAD
jgi:hypothetical protein